MHSCSTLLLLVALKALCSVFRSLAQQSQRTSRRATSGSLCCPRILLNVECPRVELQFKHLTLATTCATALCTFTVVQNLSSCEVCLISFLKRKDMEMKMNSKRTSYHLTYLSFEALRLFQFQPNLLSHLLHHFIQKFLSVLLHFFISAFCPSVIHTSKSSPYFILVFVALL